MAPPSLLLFGPQTTLPSPEQFEQLRLFFRSEPLLQKFYEAIQDLPNFWQLLAKSDPSLQVVAGLEAIKTITEWLETGDIRDTSSLSNVLRTPLTVIIHIIQYFQYLTILPSSTSGSKHHNILENCKKAGIQGLCTGLLSSISVACAKDESEVGILGASALRLAVCIGAYVDLDGCSAEKSACFTVRWKSEENKGIFMKLMASFPRAYISVILDGNNVTVTIPRSNQSAFSKALAQKGILAKLIEVEGRFHSSTQQKTLEKVTELCNNLSCIQLPSAESLGVPVRANVDGRTISQGFLSQIVAASLLTNISDWQCTISATTGDIPKDSQVTTFGFCDLMPPSIARSSNFKITRVSNLPEFQSKDTKYEYPESAVAIIGMGCKYAGADSLDEFWQVISEGASMCEELPRDRWPLTGLRRTKEGSRYWGNFVRDPDAFDHAFFKKSSREAAAMDPQQRLLLQVAYHTVESSGYFGEDYSPKDIGCYIGVATTDYHDNLASHPVTAFSALGELRAFLCGRISHHFGWTGPSLTCDTACSSSMVAIDAACKAIQSGQCTRALAGGVSVNTSPNLWENLRGANFLSPTGPTKPFDAKADGYCRGEGVGLVFLKKLSAAVQDGDFVLGVIAGSGVNQCKNETYITVPHGPSQVQLYKKTVEESGFKAFDISFIESHGTGTQAGDPVEIESIRQVFGGAQRENTLHVGSVKGNIGHCEASSGVASLIKTVLMIQKESIPPLASHQSLNPKIPSLELSKMAIPRSLMPWENSLRASLVSNYGAAGNNAAAIVGQFLGRCELVSGDLPFLKVPIFISAQSENSLAAYSKALKSLIKKNLSSPGQTRNDLANLAYNLAHKHNRSLKYSIITSATSLADLTERLDTSQPILSPPAKPVVLVFGGQTNNHVGLSKIVYKSSTLFRGHLDHCNEVMRAAGLEGIFPTIFQTKPVSDIVNLHCMFFAIQYACAKSWMDSGVRPAAIIGHSFGQLSAMCLSGCLSLEDSIKLVAGRAALMQKYWGEEAGSMISLEADIDTASGIVSAASDLGFKIEIACYNGPMSHVVVGTAKAMDSVEEMIANKQSKHGVVCYKRLNVTHGFHSQFTDPLLPGLTELAAQLKFSKATIPLETCSTKTTWEEITPTQIAEHTRTAVYFQEAVERIATRLGSCTWLEAGSNSSVTGMVRRALGSSADLGHSYQAMKLSGDGDVLGGLADATTNLWKLGHKVQFWPFHRSQSSQYLSINLPPYQFEKSRHWLVWKGYAETGPAAPVAERDTASEKFELLKLVSRDQNRAKYTVDPRSEDFKIFVQGHAVLDQPLCPADLYVELASKAALQLMPDQVESYIPSVEKLSIIAPLGIDPSRTITLSLIPQRTEKEVCWEFKFTSQARANPQKSVSHASGQIILARLNDQNLALEFQRYERLIGSGRAISLLAEPDSEGMQGNLVYKSFSRVVNYAKYYQGVKRISSKSDEVAAQIVMPQQENKAFANALMDPIAVDNFIQVAGIKVNCLNACPVGQVYICGYIEKIQASKEFIHRDPESQSWAVVANCTPMGEKDYLNDVYVFNENKRLVMMIHGVRFTRVAIVSLAKAISAASAAKPNPSLEPTNSTVIAKTPKQESKPLQEPKAPKSTANVPSDKSSDFPRPEYISSTLRNLLNKVADVPLDSLSDLSKFGDLGIDSLMSTEVLAEINQAFNVDISAEQFQDLQDISSLSTYLLELLGVSSSPSLTSSFLGIMTPSPITSSSSSISDEPQVSDGNPVAKLAKLVAGQLDISVAMTADICLGDYGLDSLVGVQLANDIEEEFGISLGSSGISPEITFGKLAQRVLPPSRAGPRSQPSIVGAIGNMQESELSAIPLVFKDVPPNAKRMPGDRMKTILFKQAGPTALFADIYLPDPAVTGPKRPIALMIHGGGHTMLSRKDVRPRQTELLLANGFLPVSIDYRLCPEMNIIDGPITDVCDALKWARTELPQLDLGVPDLVVDGDKVVVVGWSTGGTLSMTLGFTAAQRGVKPPDATLAFYCPSDYEADCWKKPNYPENTQEKCPEDYDLLEGVQDQPLTAYNVDPRKGATGGWMSLSDPRSRIVLHMNWKGQALPILLNGLPTKASMDSSNSKSYLSLPQPPQEKIIAISPYSQIVRGNYRVPTYLIHGTRDDLIPWQQMQRTHEALREKGVPTGLGILEGAVHLFDLYSGRKEKEWAVVTEGYKFLFDQLKM